MTFKVFAAAPAAALLALAACNSEVPQDEVDATIDQADPDVREQVVEMPSDPGTVETREKIEDAIEEDIADEPN